MIKTYSNVLEENLIEKIITYMKLNFGEEVWGSSVGWDQNLSLMSSNTLTHKIKNKSIAEEIQDSVEREIGIKFENERLNFISSIYIWVGGSYITWHPDLCYPYNGTIYLNKEWDSNDGGLFLYKDNQTNEIKGIEPIYNTMIVNSATESDPHNSHCVTCIVPGTIKKRITIQWRTSPKEKKFTYQY
jgi:hypothetical protein